MTAALATADFDKGTATSQIAVADAGSATAWTQVVTGTANHQTYDTTHVAHGTNAAKILNGPSAGGTQGMEWDTTVLGTLTEHWNRVYLYLTANPASTAQLLLYQQTGSSSLTIELSTTGKIIVADAGFTTTGTTTNSAALNQWIRIEFHVVQSTGACELLLFNTADSITPDETLTCTPSPGRYRANVNQFYINLNILSYSYWVDQIAAAATAYPGPFPVNTTPCTVTGSAPVGSTLTANAGVWNSGGTFTLTYQWQKDGVNIGGATGTTYVTQAGDAGHAIGVVETATGVQATNESAATTSSNAVTVTASSSTKVPIDSFAYSTSVYARDTTYQSTDAAVSAVPGLFIPSGGAKTATTSFVYFDATLGRTRSIWTGDKVAVTDNAYLAAPGNFA